MANIVKLYSNKLQETIETNNSLNLFNNKSNMELNWFGPIYSGIGETLEECCEIFYKKLYYSVDEKVLNKEFKIEIIVNSYSTKIRYIVNDKIRITYDKIFNNKSFFKSTKEIYLFNNRLLKLNHMNNKLPKYISNRINNKYKFLLNDNDCFQKIENIILSNKRKFIFPPELLQNIIICTINVYY